MLIYPVFFIVHDLLNLLQSFSLKHDIPVAFIIVFTGGKMGKTA